MQRVDGVEWTPRNGLTSAAVSSFICSALYDVVL